MKALAIAAAVVVMLAVPASARERPHGPCVGRSFWSPPGTPAPVVAEHVINLIDCAVATWPVPGGAATARCIAERESHLDPHAVNTSSGAAGVYQHLPRYWPARARAYLRPEWFPNARGPIGPFRARANVIVTMRMVHGGSWSPWGGGAC